MGDIILNECAYAFLDRDMRPVVHWVWDEFMDNYRQSLRGKFKRYTIWLGEMKLPWIYNWYIVVWYQCNACTKYCHVITNITNRTFKYVKSFWWSIWLNTFGRGQHIKRGIFTRFWSIHGTSWINLNVYLEHWKCLLWLRNIALDFQPT